MTRRLFLGSLAFACLFRALSCSADAAWFDRSHKIFFPPGLQETIAVSQEFPVFWWNFVVLDLNAGGLGADWSGAQKLCRDLKSLSPGLLPRVECNPNLSELVTFASDWAEDLPLRSSRPDDSVIREKLDSALAQASLPAGDRSLIRLLQADPLGTWHELRKLVESRLKMNLERKQGFFLDPASNRVVIPIQTAFGPADTLKTRKIQDTLRDFGERASLIGPHGSTLRNEEQVTHDLDAVTWAGYAVLAVFGAALLFFRRWKLLLLVPPVIVSVALGAWVTILVFGSIHGLTLSLGAGIIGLVLDYGFNAALSDPSTERLTWRSNWIGVITTLVGLFVLMTSSIPLLRQMMLFASVGLIAGFILFRFLIRRYPSLFLTRSSDAAFSPNTAKTACIAFLIAASLGGLFTLHPDLDMKQFDFQDEKTKLVTSWLYKTLDFHVPLFTIHRGAEALGSAHQEREWAQKSGVSVENVANYLPEASAQAENLRSWNTRPCMEAQKAFPDLYLRFFASFVNGTLCRAPQLRLTGGIGARRAYTWHLNSEDRWISLWMPSSDAQESRVREAFPQAHSLREVVSAFPQTLAHELRWMAPLSVLLVLVVLLIYYRRVSHTLIALVPFLSGLGLFTILALALRLQVSFITVVGLVMCFGFSFDYAVFAVDRYAFSEDRSSDTIWEAISTAACATLAGFIPLLFCKHPVLRHLGQALCISTIGCYFGAVWGVPGLMTLISRSETKRGSNHAA